MTTVLVLAGLLAGAPAQAQTPPPQRGIEAESAGRWQDALIVYLDELSKRPSQPDLWVRVADIHARLGQAAEALRALEHAAAVAPSDAAVHHRLSQAYAAAGQSTEALAAITRARTLAPDAPEYLRAHATLATWAGRYGDAQASYRVLRRMFPAEVTLALDLARVSAWSGSTDEAAGEYRKYLEAHPDAAAVWIELARTESWRGNFPAAIEALDRYRERFGESPDYSRELAAALARGGRPREATELIERLLAGQGEEYSLHLSRTVALASLQRRSEAISSLEDVRRAHPTQPETRGAERLLRSAIASTAEPRGTAYHDSDGLRVQRFTPRLSVALLNGTRLEGGYERADLRARAGSGLDQVTGAVTARQEVGWVGLKQRIGPLTFGGRGGYAWQPARDLFTYNLAAQVDPSDTVHLAVSRDSGYFVVSPRTVGLGLTRLAHAAQFEWMPSMKYTIAVDGSVEDISDGNRRWDVLVAPRRLVARTQRFNLDMGVRLRQFGATRNLDHGYYDPHRYESYAMTAFPYWKISENAGLAMSLAVGAQRDDAWTSFRLGGDAAVEATFGIYEAWMLKLNAAITVNERTESGAFRAYGLGAALVRRF